MKNILLVLLGLALLLPAVSRWFAVPGTGSSVNTGLFPADDEDGKPPTK